MAFDRAQLLEFLRLSGKFTPSIFDSCITLKCILRELMDDNGTLSNCTYRYTSVDQQTTFALWMDGPSTTMAAVLSLVSCFFAVRFLVKAGLNKDLTAALFSLCIIDSMLMCTVFFFYSIEALGYLLFNTNLMYNHQGFTTSLHGVASSMTTSSTLLVIYITFQRFMVVMLPLRYANSLADRSTRATQRRRNTREGQKYITDPTHRPLAPAFSSTMSFIVNIPIRKMLKPYLIPSLVILLSFAINIPVYFEFVVESCWDEEHRTEATCPTPTVFRNSFTRYKAVLNTLTQTIGPVATISLLTILTEVRVHKSLRARRKLFESQKRNRNVMLTEELKERVSRTVSIFIAVKFVILRSMPVFFDVYENLYGIESFGVVLSILVRISDFMIVLNSATNSLAYFGKKRWLEKRLRLRLLKKEERKQRKLSNSGDSWRMHLAIPRQVLSCTTSICPTTATEVSGANKPLKRNSQSCKISVDQRPDSNLESSALLGSSEERTVDEGPESPSGTSLSSRPTCQLVHGRHLDGNVRRYSNHSGRSQDSINAGF